MSNQNESKMFKFPLNARERKAVMNAVFSRTAPDIFDPADFEHTFTESILQASAETLAGIVKMYAVKPMPVEDYWVTAWEPLKETILGLPPDHSQRLSKRDEDHGLGDGSIADRVGDYLAADGYDTDEHIEATMKAHNALSELMGHIDRKLREWIYLNFEAFKKGEIVHGMPIASVRNVDIDREVRDRITRKSADEARHWAWWNHDNDPSVGVEADCEQPSPRAVQRIGTGNGL